MVYEMCDVGYRLLKFSFFYTPENTIVAIFGSYFSRLRSISFYSYYRNHRLGPIYIITFTKEVYSAAAFSVNNPRTPLFAAIRAHGVWYQNKTFCSYVRGQLQHRLPRFLNPIETCSDAASVCLVCVCVCESKECRQG